MRKHGYEVVRQKVYGLHLWFWLGPKRILIRGHQAVQNLGYLSSVHISPVV